MAKKILLVDDEPAVLALMKTRLQSWGFVAETAENGTDAVRIAGETKPDIIFLDVIMPGLNGFETCRMLKSGEQTAKIPVFLFTALQDAELEKKAREAGALKVILKPHLNELLASVNEVLK